MRAALIASLLVTASGAALAQDAGDRFRDCADCPELVVVPADTFTMGAVDDASWILSEFAVPAHTVEITHAFALGRFELRWTEYEACVADGGCPALPRPVGSAWYGTARDDHPLILSGAAAEPITGYLAWLAAQTGHSYRLPSEAEWEYAAGAGTWPALGPDITEFACDDNFAEGEDRSGADPRSWACFVEPVDRTPANAFGVHGMLGNVAEWTADCWHDDFIGAPADGSAWIDDDQCTISVIKGGTAAYGPMPTRSNWRWYTEYYHPEGFRVARDLP